MQRIRFSKGEQKDFLNKVLENLNSPSLRGLLQFGINTNYSSLKSFSTERRCLPSDLFDDLCYLAKINKQSLHFSILKNNWGQQKGGKISKRTKTLKIKK